MNTPETRPPTIPPMFRYWADTPNRVASVALLTWLGKYIATTEAWSSDDGQRAIDLEQLAYNSGAWSGGERRVAAVALSLLGVEPCNLEDVLGGLGGQHRAAVVQAIAYAGGIHTPGPLPL